VAQGASRAGSEEADAIDRIDGEEDADTHEDDGRGQRRRGAEAGVDVVAGGLIGRREVTSQPSASREPERVCVCGCGCVV
jgi:hypothetical protein